MIRRQTTLSLGFLAWASVAALAQSSGVENAQAETVVETHSIDEFLKTTTFRGASFSPDAYKILVSGDQSGVFNAYALPVDGGDPVMLTRSTDDSIYTIGYFPDDERFLYTADQGGNELNHVYLRELDGSVRDLTPGDALKAVFLGWSRDDEAFYVGTNERDRRFFDAYEYRVADFSREMIFKNEDGYQLAEISPDGQQLALVKVASRNDSDIYLFNRATGSTDHLTPHDGEINHRPQAFSPDGKSLYLTTDADSEFRYLVRHDLQTGERQVVEKPNWDVSSAAFSKHGKYFVVRINEDARSRLLVYEYATMQPMTLPSFSGANVDSVRISRDEQHLALYVSSGRMPSDVFYLGRETGQLLQLTRSLNSQIEPEELVEGEVVRFTSFDGTEIPGVLYTPHQATPDAKAPALVWVHGGPGGQSRIGYRALIQYLVNHGFVVYAINNRGSSGYGKSFQQADDQRHGQGDLDDCVASKRMLIETGYVDGERIGIIGGSYGGYMVLAALAFRPDEFDCGVDIFGVANWHRTVQNIPPWWESQRAALEKELGDFSNEEYFRSISPLFHADRITRPLLVLQGANDPRVLKVESDEMVSAVKANGVPVEYMVFDDEGHGFRKKENQREGYSAILRFVEEHLVGAEKH